MKDVIKNKTIRPFFKVSFYRIILLKIVLTKKKHKISSKVKIKA